jgi:hypothetical protein
LSGFGQAVGFGAIGGLFGGVLGALGGKVVSLVASKIAQKLPTLTIDAAKLPNIAQNIQSAIDDGHPSILTRADPGVGPANRAVATRGFSGPGSPDQYPFATTVEGGTGARVTGVPLEEQHIQGGLLTQFFRANGIRPGDQFKVTVQGLSK